MASNSPPPSDAQAIIAYVGIGANLGEAADTVRRAIAALDGVTDTRLRQHSPLYASAPVDADGDDYVNAVAQVSTSLGPLDLLGVLQAIEADFGRERSYRNAPRTLDLDLLLYDDAVLNMPALTVPHPRMTQRAFVLLPLLDIAPDIIIPGYGAARTFLPSLSAQQIRLL